MSSCNAATVIPHRTIGRDWAKVRPICYICYDLRYIPRSTSMRRRAITNDWRISMARAIVGNRATKGGSDHRPMYDQSLRPATDATINRIVASSDRWYDHSWVAPIDRTITRSIVRPVVRSTVATYDRSYDQSWRQTSWNRRRFEHDHRPCYD